MARALCRQLLSMWPEEPGRRFQAAPAGAPWPRNGSVIFKFKVTVSVAPRPEDSAAK